MNADIWAPDGDTSDFEQNISLKVLIKLQQSQFPTRKVGLMFNPIWIILTKEIYSHNF
jgi:hypothetical protein